MWPSGSMTPTWFSSMRGRLSGAVSRVTPKTAAPARSASAAAMTNHRPTRRGGAVADGSGGRVAGRGSGQIERAVLAQHGVVERAQLGAGLDADLLDQHAARVAIGLERLGLTSGAVQREHALGVQPLGQRMLGDEPLELPDQLPVAAGGEASVDRQLGRMEAQLLQPPDLGGGERLAGDVGQRVAPPQPERLARLLLLDQALEANGVDAFHVELQLITAPVGDDLGAVAVEQPPELGDVELHHLRRGRRRVLAPEPIHQQLDRDGRVGAEREHRQQRALLRRAERDRPAMDCRLDRPEQLKVHTGAQVLRRVSRPYSQ